MFKNQTKQMYKAFTLNGSTGNIACFKEMSTLVGLNKNFKYIKVGFPSLFDIHGYESKRPDQMFIFPQGQYGKQAFYLVFYSTIKTKKKIWLKQPK